MFKVAQINSVCGFGSTGKIVTDIHNQLINSGVESIVGYGRGTHRYIDDKHVYSLRSKVEQACHLAGSRVFDNHGLHSVKATKNLIAYLKNQNPDIYHLHNIHGYYLNYPMLFDFLKRENKPVVWTLHDCWSFTGHCAYFDYAQCEKWKIQCQSCPEKSSYPKSLLKDNSSRNYSLKKEVFNTLNNLTIVTPSQWLKRRVAESFLREHKVEVIPNGINLDVFKPRQSDIRNRLNLSEDKLVVLGVANIWERRKGLDDFLKIAQAVGEKAQFVIVGLDSNQLKNLPSNVVGLERTSSVDELVELYSAADIYLNTTLEDNFPTTNLESLACGTFGITYDTGGSSEAYTSETGYVVDKGDTQAIIEYLLSIVKDGITGNNKDCFIHAQERYSHSKSANGYLRLYKRVKILE
ncbi:TPA: glycosyltransferase [Vibrio parahaemolyticus]